MRVADGAGRAQRSTSSRVKGRRAARRRRAAGGRGQRARSGSRSKTNRVARSPCRPTSGPGSTAPAGVTLIDDPGVVAVPDVCTSRENCDASIRAGDTALGRQRRQLQVLGAGHHRARLQHGAALDADRGALRRPARLCDVGHGARTRSARCWRRWTPARSTPRASSSMTRPAPATKPGGEIYARRGLRRARSAWTSRPRRWPRWCAGRDRLRLAANRPRSTARTTAGELVSVSDPNVRGMAHVEGIDACGGEQRRAAGTTWQAASAPATAGTAARHGSPRRPADRRPAWFSPGPTVRNVAFPGLEHRGLGSGACRGWVAPRRHPYSGRRPDPQGGLPCAACSP